MAASIAQPHKGLADLVQYMKANNKPTSQAEDEHPQTPPLGVLTDQDTKQDRDTAREQHAEHLQGIAEKRAAAGTGAHGPEDEGKPHLKMPSEGQESIPPSKPRQSKESKRRPTINTEDLASPRTSNASRAYTQPSGSRHVPRKSTASGTRHHPPPGTPCGPPRSISYHYSLSGSGSVPPPSSISSDHHEEQSHFLSLPGTEEVDDPDNPEDFVPATSPFRGALEYDDPEQREREREIAGKREKRRERDTGSYFPEVWNPVRWLTESPKLENQGFTSEPEGEDELPNGPHTAEGSSQPKPRTKTSAPSSPRLGILQRSRSMPHMKKDSTSGQGTAPKWGRLRSLLPHLANQGRAQANAPSGVVPHSVNITDELMVGGLSTLMLRLWFERDEKGHRRIPILFHHLRIRVSDSLHPMHGHKAVFRIECEYANGAARWVVYRQLREFLSLHTHYTFSNAYNRNVETLPDFPKTSLPYFKWLKERDSEVGRAEFARMQREALENYLIGLIRAVMFHPAANRLASFLEISALSIALAQSGGAQYKAGFLRIQPSRNKGGFGHKNVGWKEKTKQRWCSVRESYLVVLEEMGELTVFDVFLIDQDFKIERPTRYYRQGLNLLTLQDGVEHHHEHHSSSHPRSSQDNKSYAGSTFGSIKHSITKALHLKHHNHSHHSHHAHNNAGGPSNSHPREGTSNTHLSPPSQRRPQQHRGNSDEESSGSDSDSSDDGQSSRPLTPMLDPSTNTNPLDDHTEKPDMQGGQDGKKKKRGGDVSKHVFYIENSQMRLKLFAKNERQMLQWIAALEKVARESHFTGKNRFDSFAPIRLNVAAQWLVDGRDYFWNLSRALLLARESIYIHDWWLSPELKLRRPGMDKYRLDHLLERKAKEGVKIYIIVYQEVSSRTTPTDSNYTKQRLTALHPNIMVQRSPSHFQTGTFYWAHHEKLCVIDQTIAFMGGLDACFGRWDTPQHVLVDDPELNDDPSEPIWPGKDYSNPRVTDFHTLNKPDEDMYDRSKVPRMPWHDVSMQVVGQPARDLARHFVQRWNYLLRIKNHTRQMPMLLPPPEFKPGELSSMGLTGTCELQICRSAGAWSLGTPERTEFSIQNAYLKAIQLSEHFVYIENQFFITSTVVNEVKIENRIGDALVHRIIRAHREGTPWKCCVVIPLLPGFTFPVDHSDASAIRIILECQNRTICRGPNSIFARLRKEGIDPDDYISFFSLRNWGKLRGDVLTTEQVYIHGKVCIVDDRLAIIGSANINERSQRGDRDSELAAVIRDTDMIDSKMAGKPYKVGRFAHTLRVRLMREHLGVDVDAMYEDDLMAFEPTKPEHDVQEWDPDAEQEYGREEGVTHVGKGKRRTATKELAHDAVDGLEQALHGTGDAEAKDVAMLLRKTGMKTKNTDATVGDASLDEERRTYNEKGDKVPGFTSSIIPTLEEKAIAEQLENENGQVEREPKENGITQNGDAKVQNGHGNGHANGTANGDSKHGEPEDARVDGELYGAPAGTDPSRDGRPQAQAATRGEAAEDEQKGPTARSQLRRHLTAKLGSRSSARPWVLPTPTPHVDPHGFDDPVCDEFWKDVWVACAVHNTEIFRKVFHAIPDDLVTTWKQYKEFIAHHERLNKPARDQPTPEPVARIPSETADAGAPGQPSSEKTESPGEDPKAKDYAEEQASTSTASAQPSNNPPTSEARGRKQARGGPEPFSQSEREEMERLLEELRGHLVIYPTRFLEGEDIANNFLFNTDRLLPLPIYD
ncbi:phospholipase D [Panus rudis PR-1116 ss-1]|nr:phospholipase D [Panus rudis PR-1116 ss-1]